MKQPFTSGILLLNFCLSFSFAQGIHGNVQLRGQATVLVTGHSVILTWNASQNATSYNVYRGTKQGGPYAKLLSGIVDTTYTDVHVTHNQTFYYVTTAVSSSESGYSNEATATIP
jgi:fibronectin type 3 domain-containing protein